MEFKVQNLSKFVKVNRNYSFNYLYSLSSVMKMDQIYNQFFESKRIFNIIALNYRVTIISHIYS